ncbi:thiamine diphosphokinase [uncultured Anaerococcus sp.]|uniref:thiamine diphosphokinase n=1 Tax=uncultured Anaerococcus sp. TaxID=293428 RepID=UPI0025CD47B3|nr:thiamine diphosphokinase [uncultured Anaerococcus sp.]
MKKCFIIGGGDFDGFFNEIYSEDLVIAADRGYDFAVDEGINPDYVIGDFDSTDRPDFPNIVSLNPIKDFTDTVAAIDFAIEKGYRHIIIYGGLGGRESHTISNIKSILYYKKSGIDISLRARGKEIFVIDKDFSYKYTGNDFYVSIFSLSQKSTLDIKGLYYELDGYTMTNDDALGVSNETKGCDFKIGLREGYLLVIFEDFDI